MELLLLSCGDTDDDLQVLHTDGMQKNKQTNKQTKKTLTIVESIAEIP